MRKITRTFENITITVCRPTNAMRSSRDRVYVMLSIPEDRIIAIRQDEFAKIVAYTESVSGLDFEFPKIDWDRERLIKAFKDFDQNWDGALTEWWLGAVEAVMAPISPELGNKPLSEDANPN